MTPSSSHNCLKITTHHDSTTDNGIDSGSVAADADRGSLGRQYALFGASGRAGVCGPAAAGTPSVDLPGSRGAHGTRDPCVDDRGFYAAGVGGTRPAGIARAWINCRLPAALP